MLKNRTLLGILCIILAIAVSFGLAPLVNKVTAEKVTIVRLAADVAQGKQIAAGDIETVTVGRYHLPDDVIKSADEVVGKYAACDLKKEDYLLPPKLSEKADGADDVFHTLNGTQQAISITIASFADGLSGKLQNGDIVSILVTPEGDNKTASIPAELKYVKLITTTTANGSDKNELTQKKDGTYDLPSTVTLLVNSRQAVLLAGYEAKAKMHIALVYRGDEATANKFLEAQNVVLSGKEVPAGE